MIDDDPRLVRRWMSPDVVTVVPSTVLGDASETMSALRVRHLPVVEDNVVIGMISIGDLVEAIISDQQEEIEHLEHYISG